ncbi:MAG: hypothetical protein ACRDKZ_03925 [Actinomycetota bacterium]
MAAIPQGDPETLRAAARTFGAAAQPMATPALSAGARAVDQVAAWDGFAAVAHGAACATLARDMRAATDACERAAATLMTLAAELEDIQEDARRSLAAMQDAEHGANNLGHQISEAGSDSPPGLVKLLSIELADARSHIAGLQAHLAELEQRAQAARDRAEAAFDAVTTSAPLVGQASGSATGLHVGAIAGDPRLALLVDVIAAAGTASSPKDLREGLRDLTPQQLAFVLEAAPGLGMVLVEAGLPADPQAGSPEAQLAAALEVQDSYACIDAVKSVFEGLSAHDAMMLALLFPAVVGTSTMLRSSSASRPTGFTSWPSGRASNRRSPTSSSASRS